MFYAWEASQSDFLMIWVAYVAQFVAAIHSSYKASGTMILQSEGMPENMFVLEIFGTALHEEKS
jgi:hypothetical protein